MINFSSKYMFLKIYICVYKFLLVIKIRPFQVKAFFIYSSAVLSNLMISVLEQRAPLPQAGASLQHGVPGRMLSM